MGYNGESRNIHTEQAWLSLTLDFNFNPGFPLPMYVKAIDFVSALCKSVQSHRHDSSLSYRRSFPSIPPTSLSLLSTLTPNQQTIPAVPAAYVTSVTINGVPSLSRCHLDFYDAFHWEVLLPIKLRQTFAWGALPESLSTGGFSNARSFRPSRKS